MNKSKGKTFLCVMAMIFAFSGGVTGSIWCFRIRQREFHYKELTRPERIIGKSVYEIVRLLGKPDVDVRDFNGIEQPTAFLRPPTYSQFDQFDGDVSYEEPFGEYFCRIRIQRGIATQLTVVRDMR